MTKVSRYITTHARLTKFCEGDRRSYCAIILKQFALFSMAVEFRAPAIFKGNP